MTVLSRLLAGVQCSSRILQHGQCWRGSAPPSNSVILRGLRQPRLKSREGGMNLAPKLPSEAPNEGNMWPGLGKSFAFAGAFCGSTFVAASLWQYESVRHQLKQNSWSDWANQQWNSLGDWEWNHKEGSIRQAVNRWWNELRDGGKVFWGICFLNGIVYACWNNVSMQQTMFRYFCSNPAARAVCWPMVLSMFSHFSFIHFAMNMYVLHSFCTPLVQSLGKEQFMAVYLSGGVMSCLASHVFKVTARCPGPSLGASGAIFALLGYFCTQYPHAQLGIVFIPNLSFSADTAIKAAMCIDAVGMAMGWRVLDHAAHLGGALFGLCYAHFGQKYIWANSEPLMKKWHEFRTTVLKESKSSKSDD